jgi:hypothetical protein
VAGQRQRRDRLEAGRQAAQHVCDRKRLRRDLAFALGGQTSLATPTADGGPGGERRLVADHAREPALVAAVGRVAPGGHRSEQSLLQDVLGLIGPPRVTPGDAEQVPVGALGHQAGFALSRRS